MQHEMHFAVVYVSFLFAFAQVFNTFWLLNLAKKTFMASITNCSEKKLAFQPKSYGQQTGFFLFVRKKKKISRDTFLKAVSRTFETWETRPIVNILVAFIFCEKGFFLSLSPTNPATTTCSEIMEGENICRTRERVKFSAQPSFFDPVDKSNERCSRLSFSFFSAQSHTKKKILIKINPSSIPRIIFITNGKEDKRKKSTSQELPLNRSRECVFAVWLDDSN